MRVAHFVPVLDQAGSYGGPTAVCELLCDELSARGHRVDIVGARPAGVQPWQPAAGRRWRLRVLAGVRIAGSRQPGAVFSLPLVWWFVRRARALDCVHLHGVREPMSVAVMLVCLLLRTPFVVQAHGMVPDATWVPVWDPLCSRVLRHAHVVLCLTQREADAVRTRRRCPRVVLFANPGPPQLAPRDPGDLVLSCSRLHPRKRVGLFLDMARLVLAGRPSAQFVVVGPPEGDERLVEEAVAELPGSVLWVPGVPPQEARRWIADAAVLVVTAENEPFGMTIVEALSSGTPVLGTWDLELAPALTEAGAMTAVAAEPQALSTALVRLLDDPDLRRRQGAAGREWVGRHASAAVLVDRLLGLYPAAHPRRGATS